MSTTPSTGRLHIFKSRRAMAAIVGGCGLLAGASIYGIAAMKDPHAAAKKDSNATITAAKPPERLLAVPIDIGPMPAPKAETATAAEPATTPAETTRPAPAAPTIEDMARANAAAAAWQDYYTKKAEIEKKRVEAIQAGLTSPMTSKTAAGPAAAPGPGSAAMSASSAPSIPGMEFAPRPQHGGSGATWASADSKQAWASSSAGNGADYVPSVRHGTVSPYEIMAGTMIRATTKGGMISDAPGQIVGQISQDVRCNTPAGGLCIPQDSTLLLSYNNRVSNGETRLQVAAERLIFPDATSMDLGRMIVADASGYAGLEDEYQTHLGARLLNAALFTTVQGAFTLGSAALGANQVNGQAVESVAAEETRAGLRVPPTLRIRPGFPFVVTLPKDLVFEAPYSFDDGTASSEDIN